MIETRESLLLTGTSHPSDVIPLGPRPRPSANLPRRVVGGAASFGGVAFRFQRAIRRVDETVLVEVDAKELLSLFEAVAQHGVAQFALGSTLCRARAIGWEPEARCLVFELHRHGRVEAPISSTAVSMGGPRAPQTPRASAANDTSFSWEAADAPAALAR